MTKITSAPGSLMLFGEHAVLHGEPAIVAAINKTITITSTTRNDERIIIESSFGHYETTLNELAIKKPLEYVLATLCHFKSALTHGMDITIESEFDATLGLGSSAAVTVAMVSLFINDSKETIFQTAKHIMTQQQGAGSGADIAASVYGGACYYDMESGVIQSLPRPPALHCIYSGYKTPTRDVIAHVNQRAKKNIAYYQTLYHKIGNCTRKAKNAFEHHDWNTLGTCMQTQQQLMQQLGVSDERLDHLIKTACETDGILGAKISGSGLGDCIIALGEGKIVLTQDVMAQGARQLNIQLSNGISQ